MTDTKMETLLRKIRALKAKAEGTNNENEAAAFAAKVAELLAAHGLEESQLRVEEQSGIEHELAGDDGVLWKQSAARMLLVRAVARLYMTEIIKYNDGSIIMVGRKTNIMMTREMSEYLIKTVMRMSNAWKRANGATDTQKIDFRRGCLVRLVERIRELHRQQSAGPAQYTAGGNPGNLPALYGQESNLLRAYASAHLNVRWVKGKTARIKHGDSAMAGRAAAEGVSLSRQVGASRSGALLLTK